MHSERPLKLSIYKRSEEYYNFIHNLSKVSLLLVTSEKCKKNAIAFEPDDMKLYSDLKRTAYTNCPDVHHLDMKNDFYQILIEQSIVLIITSWECYFSDVIANIFNNGEFVLKIANDKISFEEFSTKFQLSKQICSDLLTNINNSETSFNFGTYLFEKRKVSCQRIDDIKYIFNKYFSYIDLNHIGNDNWEDIEQLFVARHSIIHNQNKDILSTYDKDRILNISRRIYEIIAHIDKYLFTPYTFPQ